MRIEKKRNTIVSYLENKKKVVSHFEEDKYGKNLTLSKLSVSVSDLARGGSTATLHEKKKKIMHFIPYGKKTGNF